MDTRHFISAKVAPVNYRRRRDLPPRFRFAKAGIEPCVTGNSYQILICALVDAVTASDAMERFKRVFPGAAIGFCSPKPADFWPAGGLVWNVPEE